MRIFVSVIMFLAISSAAWAAGDAAKEVNAYNAIKVNFSKNAGKCNLVDPKPFEELLQKELFKIGVPENKGSISTAVLAITGDSFGLLGAQCSSQAVLSFQTVLGADNIVTDNPAIRAAIDRLENIPVIFWQSGRFGVQAQTQPASGGESTTAQEAVLEMVTNLVNKFKEDREME